MQNQSSLLTLTAFVFLALALPASPWNAEEPPEAKLLGMCSTTQLRDAPYGEWFDEGFDAYRPNPEVLGSLAELDGKDVQVQIFFGTWCGDSRREIPRMARILKDWGIPEEQQEWVAVDSIAEAYKQSPGGEERGKEVYRVPTFVVREGGEELGRIVEYPVLSLERDLASILKGEPYAPNYRSYPMVRRWLESGLLADANVDPAGLAGQVRSLIESEGELSAAARTLATRGQLAEAIKLHRINCNLHPESARSRARLAMALTRSGDLEAAGLEAEQALALNTDPAWFPELLDILEQTRAAAPES